MPVGEGKYDAICTVARGMADADGAIVIIFGGSYGSGFSVQAPLEIQQNLPALLENMAGQIRESTKDLYDK